MPIQPFSSSSPKFKKPLEFFVRPKKKLPPKLIIPSQRYIYRKFNWYLGISRILLTLFLLGILGYGIYYMFLKSGFFRISDVKVSGTKIYVDPMDVKEIVKQKTYNKSILLINTPELENLLRENFQGSKNMSVKLDYPDTIEITVTERVPLAIIHHQLSQTLYLVDEDGYVLGSLEDSSTYADLPVIDYEGDVKVATFIDKQMVPVYLEMLDALNEKDIKSTSMSFYPKYVKVYLEDNVEVLVGNDKNKSDTMLIVTNLLKQLVLEGKSVKKIDLRYDKVIVEY